MSFEFQVTASRENFKEQMKNYFCSGIQNSAVEKFIENCLKCNPSILSYKMLIPTGNQRNFSKMLLRHYNEMGAPVSTKYIETFIKLCKLINPNLNEHKAFEIKEWLIENKL